MQNGQAPHLVLLLAAVPGMHRDCCAVHVQLAHNAAAPLQLWLAVLGLAPHLQGASCDAQRLAMLGNLPKDSEI